MRELRDVRALIPLADADMVPPPELFRCDSRIHGQAHVARVLVHALQLIAATGFVEETVRLWAAVYLHDIAREHDGWCPHHGADAWARLATLPDVRALFARAGVADRDYPAIQGAVTLHSHGEPKLAAPDARLTKLLKDADALDRVRLGDFDPDFLRHPEARDMVRFAERLYRDTDHKLPYGRDYFARLWPEVLRLDGLVPDRAAEEDEEDEGSSDTR
jgi:hypothetical protein